MWASKLRVVKSTLQVVHARFLDDLDPSGDFLAKLRAQSKDVITEADVARINARETREEKVTFLIDIMGRKLTTLRPLTQSLQQTGHRALSKLVAETESGILDWESKADLVNQFIDEVKALYRRDYSVIRLHPNRPNSTKPIGKLYAKLQFTLDGEQNADKNYQKVLKTATKDHDRPLILKGSAGMGKSTFVRRLCYDWAQGDFEDYDIVLEAQLRYMKNPMHTLMDMALFHPKRAALPSLTNKKDEARIRKELMKGQHRILIIFDGLDEATNLSQLNQFYELCEGVQPVYPLSWRIMITSREHSVVNMKNVGKFVTITAQGFSKEEQRDFIEKFCTTSKTDVWAFLEQMDCLPDRENFTKIPLFLNLLCHAKFDMKMNGITGVFVKLLEELVPRSEHKNEADLTETEGSQGFWSWLFSSAASRRKSQQDKLKTIEDFQGSKPILQAGKLAYCGLKEHKLYFTESDLENYEIGSLHPNIFRLGFLIKDEPNYDLSSGEQIYYFPHKAFQEFLAAFFVWSELRKVEYPSRQSTPWIDDFVHLISDNINYQAGELHQVIHFLLGLGEELGVKLKNGIKTRINKGILQTPTQSLDFCAGLAEQSSDPDMKTFLKEFLQENILQMNAQYVLNAVPTKSKQILCTGLLIDKKNNDKEALVLVTLAGHRHLIFQPRYLTELRESSILKRNGPPLVRRENEGEVGIESARYSGDGSEMEVFSQIVSAADPSVLTFELSKNFREPCLWNTSTSHINSGETLAAPISYTLSASKKSGNLPNESSLQREKDRNQMPTISREQSKAQEGHAESYSYVPNRERTPPVKFRDSPQMLPRTHGTRGQGLTEKEKDLAMRTAIKATVMRRSDQSQYLQSSKRLAESKIPVPIHGRVQKSQSHVQRQSQLPKISETKVPAVQEIAEPESDFIPIGGRTDQRLSLPIMTKAPNSFPPQRLYYLTHLVVKLPNPGMKLMPKFFCSVLKVTPYLSQIDIRGNGQTIESSDFIREAKANRNEPLSLSLAAIMLVDSGKNSLLTEETMETLRVKELSLSYVPYESRDFWLSIFCACIEARMTHLSISGAHMLCKPGLFVDIINKIKLCVTLRELILESCQMTDQQAKDLIRKKPYSLKKLSLAWNHIKRPDEIKSWAKKLDITVDY